MMSRGKSIVMSSLKTLPKRQKLSPDFWIEAGLDPDGFEKKFISRYKGFGVFSQKKFKTGDFLLEYEGELLSGQNIQRRQLQHEVSNQRRERRGGIPRCFMFHFKYNGKKMCLDATYSRERLGHFVNDAKKNQTSCNAKMKLRTYKHRPRLLLFATRDIAIGEEISFDYGDDNNLWWRKEGQSADEQLHLLHVTPNTEQVNPSHVPLDEQLHLSYVDHPSHVTPDEQVHPSHVARPSHVTSDEQLLQSCVAHPSHVTSDEQVHPSHVDHPSHVTSDEQLQSSHVDHPSHVTSDEQLHLSHVDHPSHVTSDEQLQPSHVDHPSHVTSDEQLQPSHVDHPSHVTSDEQLQTSHVNHPSHVTADEMVHLSKVAPDEQHHLSHVAHPSNVTSDEQLHLSHVSHPSHVTADEQVYRSHAAPDEQVHPSHKAPDEQLHPSYLASDPSHVTSEEQLHPSHVNHPSHVLADEMVHLLKLAPDEQPHPSHVAHLLHETSDEQLHPSYVAHTSHGTPDEMIHLSNEAPNEQLHPSPVAHPSQVTSDEQPHPSHVAHLLHVTSDEQLHPSYVAHTSHGTPDEMIHLSNEAPNEKLHPSPVAHPSHVTSDEQLHLSHIAHPSHVTADEMVHPSHVAHPSHVTSYEQLHPSHVAHPSHVTSDEQLHQSHVAHPSHVTADEMVHPSHVAHPSHVISDEQLHQSRVAHPSLVTADEKVHPSHVAHPSHVTADEMVHMLHVAHPSHVTPDEQVHLSHVTHPSHVTSDEQLHLSHVDHPSHVPHDEQVHLSHVAHPSHVISDEQLHPSHAAPDEQVHPSHIAPDEQLHQSHEAPDELSYPSHVAPDDQIHAYHVAPPVERVHLALVATANEQVHPSNIASDGQIHQSYVAPQGEQVHSSHVSPLSEQTHLLHVAPPDDQVHLPHNFPPDLQLHLSHVTPDQEIPPLHVTGPHEHPDYFQLHEQIPRPAVSLSAEQKCQPDIHQPLHDYVSDSESDKSEIYPFPALKPTVAVADSTSNPSTDKQTSDEIQTVSKERLGRHDYSKKHCCPFCGKLDLKLSRHLMQKHANETVIGTLQKPSKNRKGESQLKREKILDTLRNQGDFMFNVEVLKNLKHGKSAQQLIVARRPDAATHKAEDYLPCKFCLRFYIKSDLYRHCKKCQYIETPLHTSLTASKKQEKSFISAGKQILQGAGLLFCPYGEDNTRQEFFDYILSSMSSDEIGKTVKKDSGIVKYGRSQFEKLGRHRASGIRYRMRLLARIKMKLLQKDLVGEGPDLDSYLRPENFEKLVLAVKQVVEVTEDRSLNGVMMFSKPEVAKKTGHCLKKLGELFHGQMIMERNEENRKNVSDFLLMYEMQWSDRIGSVAHQTANERKFNKKEILPATEDIVTLQKFQDDQILDKMALLSNERSFKRWIDLAKYLLSKVQTFNFRRGNEASKMLVKKYLERENWTSSNQEIYGSLDKLERAIAQRMDLVEVIGKQNRKVPVLLTKSVKAGINLLISTRDECGVSQENIFVFAKGKDSYITGSEALNYVLKGIPNLKHPENIRLPKMRKYLATVTQVLGIDEVELQEIARHMGHELSVHRRFYRMQEDVIELAKVSKLLLAVEAGNLNKFSGMSLDDIELEALPDIHESALDLTPLSLQSLSDEHEKIHEIYQFDDHQMDKNKDHSLDGHQDKHLDNIQDLPVDNPHVNPKDTSIRIGPRERRPYKRKIYSDDLDYDDEVADPDFKTGAEEYFSESDSEVPRKRAKLPKKKWTIEEKAALRKLVDKATIEQKPPRKAEIQKVQYQNVCLQNLKWTCIKHNVWAMAQQKSKECKKLIN